MPYVVHRAAAGDFLPFVEPLVPGLGGRTGGDGIGDGALSLGDLLEDLDRITISSSGRSTSLPC